MTDSIGLCFISYCICSCTCYVSAPQNMSYSSYFLCCSAVSLNCGDYCGLLLARMFTVCTVYSQMLQLLNVITIISVYKIPNY